MREKTADIFYSFCVSTGTMCIALLYRMSISTLALTLISGAAAVLICRKTDFQSSNKSLRFISVGAIVSAAVAVYTGVSVATDFALDRSFAPICLLVACGAAVALAFSTARASKSVAFVMSVVCILLLLVMFFLCILESDFTKDISFKRETDLFIPIIAFAFTDSVFVMPYIRKSNRGAYLFGLTLMPIYMIAATLLAAASLSEGIYSSVEIPIIKMWQTCYVLSFVDRFETLIICALYAICTVKAGMLLKISFDNFSVKLLPLFVILAVLMFFQPMLIYAYAALSLLAILIYFIFKKSY